MSIQNSPSEMFVKNVESPDNQGLFQHFRGLLKEKILIKFLPKSEGAIASTTTLAPTTLLIDKENTTDLYSTADPCQKEHETLVKEDSVTVTIHASADEEIVAKKIVNIRFFYLLTIASFRIGVPSILFVINFSISLSDFTIALFGRYYTTKRTRQKLLQI